MGGGLRGAHLRGPRLKESSAVRGDPLDQAGLWLVGLLLVAEGRPQPAQKQQYHQADQQLIDGEAVVDPRAPSHRAGIKTPNGSRPYATPVSAERSGSDYRDRGALGALEIPGHHMGIFCGNQAELSD